MPARRARRERPPPAGGDARQRSSCFPPTPRSKAIGQRPRARVPRLDRRRSSSTAAASGRPGDGPDRQTRSTSPPATPSTAARPSSRRCARRRSPRAAIDAGLGRRAVREIRWHARAGQGAKTASQLFARAALRAGKSVQAFPEYGPERRGAPLRAYTRDRRPADPAARLGDAARRRRRARAVAAARGRRRPTAWRRRRLVLVEREDAAGARRRRVSCVPAPRLAAQAARSSSTSSWSARSPPRSASRRSSTSRTPRSSCSAGRPTPRTSARRVEEGYRCLS